MEKILVMGLPGSGKTTFSKELKNYFENNNKTVAWFNADIIRKQYNDWDFTKEGRIRQSVRMNECASKRKEDYVICDFIAPLPEIRNNFAADYIVWMNTIEKSRYDDTNEMFIPPDVYDFCIVEKNASKWAEYVGQNIFQKLLVSNF